MTPQPGDMVPDFTLSDTSAQIPESDRLRVREHAHRATRPEDHPSSRRTRIASVSDKPSMRNPDGDATAADRGRPA